jgi:hypothetical protein
MIIIKKNRMKINYKQICNEFITRRYKFLLECATNTIKTQGDLEPSDLIAELVIYLNDNKDKVLLYIEMDKLEAFAVSWISIQGRYKTSPMNVKYASKADTMDELLTISLPATESIEYDINQNDYENDLKEIYTDEQIKKIMSVSNILDKLTKVESILFQAYFVDNLSYDKICRKYTFYENKNGKKVTYKSKTSISVMMNSLKNKIKTLIENDTNN